MTIRALRDEDVHDLVKIGLQHQLCTLDQIAVRCVECSIPI